MEGLPVGLLQRMRHLIRDHLNKNPSCNWLKMVSTLSSRSLLQNSDLSGDQLKCSYSSWIGLDVAEDVIIH